MRTESVVFRFGVFTFDSAQGRLLRKRERIPLRPVFRNILRLFLSHPGEILSHQSLAETGWALKFVDNNAVAQAVSRLKKKLGPQDDGTAFIENVPGRGYRFMAQVQREDAAKIDAVVEAIVVRHRPFVEGRAWLETLMLESVVRALASFEQAVAISPDYAPGHIGLATACFLIYQSTRADIAPDMATLERGVYHARKACELDPHSGEAWGTLALVLSCTGDYFAAIAAARTAIALEPYDWCHQLRLAFVSWGGQRLRAAQRAARLSRGLALARWFMASVLIARQLLDEALTELRTGCAAHDAHRVETDRFNAVGLHLLFGLVLAAQGDYEAALEAFARELAGIGAGHVYARECCANTWYAIGGVRLLQGCPDQASAAFREALTHVPGHALAIVGLAAIARTSPQLEPMPHAHPVNVAIVMAAFLAQQDRHEEGAQLCTAALTQAEPGSIGWTMGIDPLIHALAHLDAWAHPLEILRRRAD